MANPLTDFKTDHHVIVGIALITVGVFGVYGAITGRLAAMLAALFDPSDLVSGGTGTGSAIGNVVSGDQAIVGGATSAVSDVVNFVKGLVP